MKNDDLHEILDLLIEECSEVIQAASKVKRFGERDCYNDEPNNIKLFKELGDLLALVYLVKESMDGFNEDMLFKDIILKLKKLKNWSNINHRLLDDAIGTHVG